MKRAVILFGMLSLVSGFYLLYLSFDLQSMIFWVFFLIGLVSIGAAVNYTVGKRPYGYYGLGDVFVLIFFGWVGVGGTYFIQAGSLHWEVLLPATTIGLFSTAVLNINNIRDLESDKEAGKYSIPVRVGAHYARYYHLFLVTAGVFFSLWFTMLNYSGFTSALYIVLLPILYMVTRKVVISHDPKAIDPQLKKMALFTFFYTILFGVGLLLQF